MAHVNQNQHKNNLCNFCNLILSFCYWHDLYVHISCYKINIYKLSKFAYVITYVTHVINHLIYIFYKLKLHLGCLTMCPTMLVTF